MAQEGFQMENVKFCFTLIKQQESQLPKCNPYLEIVGAVEQGDLFNARIARAVKFTNALSDLILYRAATTTYHKR